MSIDSLDEIFEITDHAIGDVNIRDIVDILMMVGGIGVGCTG